jgi:hypothetical protein
MIKALIINYQRVELPRKMAEFLAARNVEPIFVDNNSDYPPLLEYYKTCPFTVLRMDANYVQTVVWHKNLLSKLGITGNYIVTDPDLDLSGVPDDFVEVMEEGLRRYPQYDKCGLSLEINDIPNQVTIDWEMMFWRHPLDDMYFNADTDTTFALYKHPYPSLNAIRTNRPYICKHVPWYYDLYEKLPEDELYYYRTQCQEIRSHSNILDRKPGRWEM